MNRFCGNDDVTMGAWIAQTDADTRDDKLRDGGGSDERSGSDGEDLDGGLGAGDHCSADPAPTRSPTGARP